MSDPFRRPATPALVAPDLRCPSVTVHPWPDPLLERFGYDPRSPYVERFWLPIIGPSGTVLLRRLAEGLAAHPDGFELDLADAARSLGMGRPEGPAPSFRRTIDRVAGFGFLRMLDPTTLAVRPRLPGLNVRQLKRLPPALRADHELWHTAQPSDEVLRSRVQHLARSLLQAGEDPPDVKAHLLRLDFHPTVVHHALRAALERQPAAGNDAA